MSKYLHRELWPSQGQSPEEVIAFSIKYINNLAKVKWLKLKNFADFMQLMIVSLLGTFGIFYDATVTNTIPDLSILSYCCYIIYDYGDSYKP